MREERPTGKHPGAVSRTGVLQAGRALGLGEGEKWSTQISGQRQISRWGELGGHWREWELVAVRQHVVWKGARDEVGASTVCLRTRPLGSFSWFLYNVEV